MTITKEQKKQYNQQYYKENKEKLKQQAKDYYYENQEKVLDDVQKYRNKNREVIREKDRAYYRRKPEVRMLWRARSRAKKQGWAFNLELEDIQIPTHCPLLGLELHVTEGRRSVKDNSASLDRIDSSIGYEKGNVWVISHRANTIKSNATLPEMITLVNNWIKLKGNPNDKRLCDAIERKL